MEMLETKGSQYSQDWPAYNKAQTQEGHLFMKLMSDICAEIENKPHVFGRPKLPMADMVFASALKVYSTFSLRRFVSLMRTARDKGYTDTVCAYSSVSNYMRSSEMTPILQKLIKRSSIVLASVEKDFAVDSSGFSTCRFKRWYDFGHGREAKGRIWIKAHITCGTKTNIVPAVILSESSVHDTNFFKDLVKQTAENFEINEVSADKGYCGRSNMNCVDEVGGTAYIPFRKRSKPRAKGSPLWNRMYHLFMLNQEEFMRHYHKRSNIETTFYMIKTKFGDYVRSKDYTAQTNEILLKILCHNICVVIQEMYELGIIPSFCSQATKYQTNNSNGF